MGFVPRRWNDGRLHPLLLWRSWWVLHSTRFKIHEIKKHLNQIRKLNAVSEPPGNATPAVHSEIFLQSDRIASFVLMGIQRWGLLSLLGLIFPFLIVSVSTPKQEVKLVEDTQSGRVLLSSWSCPPQKSLGSYCFICFACMCLLGGVFTFFLLPETRGKTLVEISTEFSAISVCGLSLSQQSSEATKLWETEDASLSGTASSCSRCYIMKNFFKVYLILTSYLGLCAIKDLSNSS